MMTRDDRRPPRAAVMVSVLTAAFGAWVLAGNLGEATAAQGTLADFFTGAPPSVVNSDEISQVRVRLDAGARAHWHSHGWGQLLLVEEGRGRIQIRGERVREMVPGEPVFTGAGVAHWHGAGPDGPLIMLSMHGGGAEWMEPVSDDVYLATPAP